MKYWLFLCAFMLAVLRAPEVAIYSMFGIAYIWFALDRIRSHSLAWWLAIAIPAPLLIIFIALPRGHSLPGLLQLGVMVLILMLVSYTIAGVQMVRTQLPKDKRI